MCLFKEYFIILGGLVRVMIVGVCVGMHVSVSAVKGKHSFAVRCDSTGMFAVVKPIQKPLLLILFITLLLLTKIIICVYGNIAPGANGNATMLGCWHKHSQVMFEQFGWAVLLNHVCRWVTGSNWFVPKRRQLSMVCLAGHFCSFWDINNYTLFFPIKVSQPIKAARSQ